MIAVLGSSLVLRGSCSLWLQKPHSISGKQAARKALALFLSDAFL